MPERITPIDMEKLFEKLTSNITLTSQGADLFSVAYRSGDRSLTDQENANLAKRVVQNLINLFVEGNIAGQREPLQETIRFLEEQIGDYEAKLEEAERRRAEFDREKQNLLANLQQVQKYYTLDKHLLNMPLIVINEKFYKSLSKEDQRAFEFAAREAAFAMLGIIAAKESQDLKTIAAAGVQIYTPTPAEFQTFVDATREPILAVMKQKVDAKWIDGLLAAIADAKKQVGQ